MATASPLTDAVPDTAEFELTVGGMTCAACAARVQAKLNKVNGVTASVNLSTERAHVTAPARVSASDLVAVVEAAGYSARPGQPGRGRRPPSPPTRFSVMAVCNWGSFCKLANSSITNHTRFCPSFGSFSKRNTSRSIHRL